MSKANYLLECIVINVPCSVNPSPGSDVFICFIGHLVLLTLCQTLYLILCAIFLYSVSDSNIYAVTWTDVLNIVLLDNLAYFYTCQEVM